MKSRDDRPEDDHRDNPENTDFEHFMEELRLEVARPIDLASIADDKGLPEQFKSTTAFRLIVDRLNYAREVRAPLALITGTHGAGKTTALRYYAHREGVVMWECRPSYHEKHLMQDVASTLGVSAGVGWQTQTSIVVDQLRANPRFVLLDEAQRLSYNGMDLLKYLADASGSTFALSASPSLEKRIDRWPDISSRCPVRVRVNTVSVEEFVELYQTEGFGKTTLLELHRLCGGVMRVLRAIMREIDIQLGIYNDRAQNAKTRADLAPVHIRTFAKRVTG